MTCDWCGANLTHGFSANGFGERLCGDCALNCCATCSRDLSNPPEEHDGCDGVSLLGRAMIEALRERE